MPGKCLQIGAPFWASSLLAIEPRELVARPSGDPGGGRRATAAPQNSGGVAGASPTSALVEPATGRSRQRSSLPPGCPELWAAPSWAPPHVQAMGVGRRTAQRTAPPRLAIEFA